MKKESIVTLLLFYLFVNLSFANSLSEDPKKSQPEPKNIINELKQQYIAGQLDSVWNTLLALQYEKEGDFEFDILFAEIALKKNQFHQAVFALERASYEQPYNNDVRLLLAKAYFKLGNVKGAKAELKHLIKNKTVLAKIDNADIEFIKSLHKKKEQK